VAAADHARRGAGGEARRAGSGAAGLPRKAALVCGAAAGHAIGRAAVVLLRTGGGGRRRRAPRRQGNRESLSLPVGEQLGVL